MTKGVIVERIQKLLCGLKCEWLADSGREPAKLGKADAAVLKVAMMIAALDGNVTDAELAAFERLAKKCRGYNAESAKTVFREGLKAAGHIELAARTLKDRELLSAFAAEAEGILPSGFAFGDAKDVRRAFVMWTAMAMADGDYSPNERKAIAFFAKSVSARMEAEKEACAQSVRGFSPAFVMAYAQNANRDTSLSPVFFKKTEELIAKLGREATATAAEKELKSLILNG